jgi:hypothetical protein
MSYIGMPAPLNFSYIMQRSSTSQIVFPSLPNRPATRTLDRQGRDGRCSHQLSFAEKPSHGRQLLLNRDVRRMRIVLRAQVASIQLNSRACWSRLHLQESFRATTGLLRHVGSLSVVPDDTLRHPHSLSFIAGINAQGWYAHMSRLGAFIPRCYSESA